MGIFEPIGHADFYPNGGTAMPGCNGMLMDGLMNIVGMCDHTRAYKYFLESIYNNLFYAVQCSTFEDLHAGFCTVIKKGVLMAERNFGDHK